MQSVHSAACRYMGSAYCLHRPQLLERSIELAVAQGCHVSLDLASFEVVRDFRRELLTILEGRHISLCICNEVGSVAAAGGCLPGCSRPCTPNLVRHARLPPVCVCLPASGTGEAALC